jgi:hypothetical protein
VPAVAPAPAQPEPVADFRNDLAAFTSNFGKLVDLSRAKIAAVRGANDDERVDEKDEAAPADVVELSPSTPRKRTRRPRDTKRWNRAAVREALNA